MRGSKRQRKKLAKRRARAAARYWVDRLPERITINCLVPFVWEPGVQGGGCERP